MSKEQCFIHSGAVIYATFNNTCRKYIKYFKMLSFSEMFFQELFWAATFSLDTLGFNVLLMCTSPQCSQRATISCIWFIMHHKVTGALYVDGLIPASSFAPWVCCLWCIQYPVTCRHSRPVYVAFLRGLVYLPRISWTCTSRYEETLWLTFKSNQMSYSTVQ